MSEISIELKQKLIALLLISANQSKMKDLAKELGVETENNKAVTLIAALEPLQAQYCEELGVEPPVEEPPVEDFDKEAYETVVFLTLDAMRRKNGQLQEFEKEKLAKAEKIAFKNPGKKALITETYRVEMKTVRLVKGLPTPPSIINLFSK